MASVARESRDSGAVSGRNAPGGLRRKISRLVLVDSQEYDRRSRQPGALRFSLHAPRNQLDCREVRPVPAHIPSQDCHPLHFGVGADVEVRHRGALRASCMSVLDECRSGPVGRAAGKLQAGDQQRLQMQVQFCSAIEREGRFRVDERVDSDEACCPSVGKCALGPCPPRAVICEDVQQYVGIHKNHLVFPPSRQVHDVCGGTSGCRCASRPSESLSQQVAETRRRPDQGRSVQFLEHNLGVRKQACPLHQTCWNGNLPLGCDSHIRYSDSLHPRFSPHRPHTGKVDRRILRSGSDAGTGSLAIRKLVLGMHRPDSKPLPPRTVTRQCSGRATLLYQTSRSPPAAGDRTNAANRGHAACSVRQRQWLRRDAQVPERSEISTAWTASALRRLRRRHCAVRRGMPATRSMNRRARTGALRPYDAAQRLCVQWRIGAMRVSDQSSQEPVSDKFRDMPALYVRILDNPQGPRGLAGG